MQLRLILTIYRSPQRMRQVLVECALIFKLLLGLEYNFLLMDFDWLARPMSARLLQQL